MRRLFYYFIALVFIASPFSVRAQQGISTARSLDAQNNVWQQQSASPDYTFKTGDLRVLVSPSVLATWNDNVELTRTNKLDDYILSPTLNLALSYPLTALNELDLTIGVGYDKYFNHDNLSTWRLQSGSGLSFTAQVKGLSINLHDIASFVQDGAQNAIVAGTGNAASYGTINNTAGLLLSYNLRDVVLSLGYDHVIEYSPSSTFQSQDLSTEELSARAGYEFGADLTAGLESTASFTTYDKDILNNNNTYTVGVYADWEPGKDLHVKPRVGFTTTEFSQTSATIQTGDIDSYYADLTMSHQITTAISYSFSGGHETRGGIQADVVEDWYCRPAVEWNVLKNVGISATLDYENGQQGAGNISGNLSEDYDLLGLSFALNYQVMKNLTTGAYYRLTLRHSNIVDLGYTQNIIGINLTYHFD